jgi:nitroreductase
MSATTAIHRHNFKAEFPVPQSIRGATHRYPWIGEKLCHKGMTPARTPRMPVNAVLRDYLKTRRSVGIGFLKDPGPTPEELQEILTIGTRVPDHGKFVPWRLVVIQGDARLAAGEKLAAIRKARMPGIDEPSLEIERRQFLPAPVTIGVILSPRPNPKAPEMEQLLSAGNVCFNLSHAAFAMGYAASWTNKWYGFDPEAEQLLGARGGERFVGFIHIGTPTTVIEDRERPALEDVVTYWNG